MSLTGYQTQALRQLKLANALLPHTAIAREQRWEPALAKNILKQLEGHNLVCAGANSTFKILPAGVEVIKCIQNDVDYQHVLDGKFKAPAIRPSTKAMVKTVPAATLKPKKVPAPKPVTKAKPAPAAEPASTFVTEDKVKKMLVYMATADAAKSTPAAARETGLTEDAARQCLDILEEKQLVRKYRGGARYVTGEGRKAAAGKVAADLTVTTTPKFDIETIQLPPAATAATPMTDSDIETELERLGTLLHPDQWPVVENIDNKQRALDGITLVIKNHAPTLLNVLADLSTDLSVIRLHQERRA